MSQPHKHRDVIIAWANGAQIQFFDVDEWIDCHEGGPRWHEEKRYRVKPKIVKREGWVNVYDYYDASLWTSKEQADCKASANRKACIRIEWEEEV